MKGKLSYKLLIFYLLDKFINEWKLLNLLSSELDENYAFYLKTFVL